MATFCYRQTVCFDCRKTLSLSEVNPKRQGSLFSHLGCPYPQPGLIPPLRADLSFDPVDAWSLWYWISGQKFSFETRIDHERQKLCGIWNTFAQRDSKGGLRAQEPRRKNFPPVLDTPPLGKLRCRPPKKLNWIWYFIPQRPTEDGTEGGCLAFDDWDTL